MLKNKGTVNKSIYDKVKVRSLYNNDKDGEDQNSMWQMCNVQTSQSTPFCMTMIWKLAKTAQS